ncbi:MAG: hypothetical protein WC747_04355 [Candidatus Babeliales bacterium]|jgi:predicted transcriptional regulator
MEIWQIAAIALSIILAVSGIVGVFYANAKNKLAKTTTDNYEKTIKSYKEIVESQELKINTLTEDMKEMRSLHTESVKMIGELQGELRTWKQLPIKELSDNMAFVVELQYLMAQHLKMDHLPPLKPRTATVQE